MANCKSNGATPVGFSVRDLDAARGFTLVELLVVIAIIGILVALLLPAVQAAREAARRTHCANNFKQAALALHNYHDANERFPPGMNMWWHAGCPNWPTGAYYGWGWGAFILPFLEEGTTHEQIDFRAGDYSAPGARDAAGNRIETYICPSDPNSGAWIEHTTGWNHPKGTRPTDDFRMTNMAGVAHSTNMGCNGNRLYVREDGNGMLFNIKGVRMPDVLDGTSHTLLLGEITGAEGQHPSEGSGYFGYIWVTQAVQDVSQGINGPFTVPGGRNQATDPVDGDGGGRHQELYNEVSFSSWHVGGAHFCFTDGSVQFVNDNIDQALLESLATRAGGEVLDLKGM